MMMCGGMPLMFFWLFFGTLLFIALIAAVVWLLAHALRSPQTRFWLKPHPQQYQQNYPDPVPRSETYEEGGHAHHYPERPSATYPQQQEKRPHL